MSTVTAYKIVGADYKSFFAAGGQGPPAFRPLQALQLTYTPGATVEADDVTGNTIKSAIRASLNNGRGPERDSIWYDLSKLTGLWAFSTLAYLFWAAAHSGPYWTPEADPVLVRIIQVTFDSDTDLIQARDDIRTFTYRLHRCYVVGTVHGPAYPTQINSSTAGSDP